MNSTIKKALIILIPIALLATVPSACIINNPQPEECEVKEVVIASIWEGTSYDIMFRDQDGDMYYINRGLEQGLTIAELQQEVLNKKVTLHLPVLLYGTTTHISQLAVAEDIVFTEFD